MRELPRIMMVGLGGTGITALIAIKRLAAAGLSPTESLRFVAFDESGQKAPEVPEINAFRFDLAVANAQIKKLFESEDLACSRVLACPKSFTKILQNPDRLYRMKPHQFEDFVADVYSN